jgi:hypothetical protein
MVVLCGSAANTEKPKIRADSMNKNFFSIKTKIIIPLTNTMPLTLFYEFGFVQILGFYRFFE